MPSAPVALRKPRSLALELVDALGDRIRDGSLAAGDKLPTEAEIMGEFGVSRTVVREAISKLQASGLVQTRHGIGTFVVFSGSDTSRPFLMKRINCASDWALTNGLATRSLPRFGRPFPSGPWHATQ